MDGAGHPLALRIGIATGPVVAGVIGDAKFSYDVWGATVNVASRMESQGCTGLIQVTSAVYERLRVKYQFQIRGVIPVKNIGDMTTYFLVSRNSG
jgi:class 3 adenylate cyclase